MRDSENLFLVIGRWWQNRQQSRGDHPRSAWLPTPGNVIFTLLVAGAIILTQNVWATPAKVTSHNVAPSATTINYQGRLADDNGLPLTGNYVVEFTIYDAPTSGNLIWGTETHANVPVSDGLFNVGLGSLTGGGIPTNVWSGDRYLQVTVDGEPLTPRELIRSVPVAGMALTALSATTATTATVSLDVSNLSLEDMEITSYYVSRSADGIYTYVEPFGETNLNPASCLVNNWCCNAENRMCLLMRSGSEDAILELNIDATYSSACFMAHLDDDLPSKSKGLYYATDTGNQSHLNAKTIRISREGQSSEPLDLTASYKVVCGW